MARYSERDPATGRFGKPGTTLPYVSVDFPRRSDQKTTRKDAPTPRPIAFLTPHTDDPALKLIAQQVDKGDNTDAVQSLVYEKIPGPVYTSHVLLQSGEVGTRTTEINVKLSDTTASSGATIEQSDVEPSNALLGTKTTITHPIPGTPQTEQVIDFDGATKTVTKTLIDAANASSSEAVGTKTEYEPLNATTGYSVTTARPVPGNTQTTDKFDSFGNPLLVARTLVATGSVIPALSLNVVDDQVEPTTGAESMHTISTVASFADEVAKTVNDFGDTVTTTVTRVVPGSSVPSLSETQFDVAFIPESKDRTKQSISTVVSNSTRTTHSISQRGDAVVRTEQIVAVGTVPTDALLTINNEVKPIDSARAVQTKDVATSYGALTEIGFDGFGNKLTTEKTIIAPGSVTPSVSFLTLADDLKQGTATKAGREVVTVDEFRPVVSKTVNPFGDTVTTTVTMVDPAATVPTPSLTQFGISFTPETKDRSKQTVSTVESNTARTTHAISSRGDAVTRTKQIVDIGTVPDDALLTVSNEVEAIDSTRSEQTKDTVASYGTLITEDASLEVRGLQELLALVGSSTASNIVAPGTDPDALSTTVISSTVKQITATKAEKVTVSLLNNLPVSVTTHKIGAQGEKVKSVKTLTNVEPTIASTFGQMSDEYVTLGTGLFVETKETLDDAATFPTLTSKELASDADGAEVDTTTQTVNSGTATLTAGGLTVLDSRLVAIDSANSKKIVRTLAGGSFPILTSKSIEPETKTPITITKQIVEAGAALTDDDPLIIDQYVRAIDKWRSIKVVTKLDSTPAPFLEFQQIRYEFPGLFYDASYDPRVGCIIKKRSAFSRTVRAVVVVTFSADQIETEPYQVKPVSWNFPLGFSVNDVLTNGESFTYVLGDDSLTVNVPNSVPSRNEYEGLIGNFTTINRVSNKWRGGLYRNEQWQIIMQ